MARRSLMLTAMGLLLLSAGGCQTYGGWMADRVYPLTAPELDRKVKGAMQVYGFDLHQAPDGTLETEFRTYYGVAHDVFPARKQWQQQTKFFIQISALPPDGKSSRLRVTSLTEERRGDNYPWQTAERKGDPFDEGPASHLIDALDEAIQKSSYTGSSRPATEK